MMKIFDGCSLKKRILKEWIYAHGYTQPRFAELIGMKSDDFKRKLQRREEFDKEQIKRLIGIMQAEDAFRVIYFSSRQHRLCGWEYVYGKRRGVLNERH